VLSSELEQKLRKEFNNNVYKATDDEIIRFTKSAEATYAKSSKRNKDSLVEKLASERLEEYFDWRQSYGLDYGNDDDDDGDDGGKKNDTNDDDDASIWKWAVERAVTVEEQAKKHHAKSPPAEAATTTTSSSIGGWFGFGGGNSKMPAKTEDNDGDGGKLVDGVKNSPGTVDYDAAITKASSQDDDDEALGEEEKEKDGKSDREKSDKKEGKETEGGQQDGPPLLPQIIFQRSDPKKEGDGLRDLKGVPILQVFAAKIDRNAGSAETWSLAVALYLERLFDRSPSSATLERMKEASGDAGTCAKDGKKRREIGNVTLLVDLRGGEHWPNPKAIMMINLIRKIVHSIAAYHPGRITAMVMYPLPRALLGVWNSVSGYFGPDVVESFHLISGPSKPGSPLPKLELQEFIDGDVLDLTEQRRNELDVCVK